MLDLVPVLIQSVEVWLVSRTARLLATLSRRRAGNSAALVRRASAVRGKWEGDVHLRHGPRDDEESDSYHLTLKLESRGCRVYGDGAYKYEGRDTECRLDGLMDVRDIVRLEYDDTDPGVVRMGALYLQLSTDASLMEGEFVGFGAEVRRIVSGRVTLRRIR